MANPFSKEEKIKIISKRMHTLLGDYDRYPITPETMCDAIATVIVEELYECTPSKIDNIVRINPIRSLVLD